MDRVPRDDLAAPCRLALPRRAIVNDDGATRNEERVATMSTVTEYLDDKGIAYERLLHERAFTGLEEARALGLEPHAVLKTILLDVQGDHVAVALPSEERLDMHLVREVVDDPEATLATEGELTSDFGFELGALPPIAPLLGVDLIVDPTVRGQGPVVFAAGSQTESVMVDAEELFANQPVRFAKVSEGWVLRRSEG